MQGISFASKVDSNKLSRLLGGGSEEQLSNSVSNKIERWDGIIGQLMRPSLNYCFKEISSSDQGSLTLENGTRLRSPKLSKALGKASEVVCFIATIGQDIEDKINECFMRNRYSDAYILDAMGSLIVENLVEDFHQRMENYYKSQNRAVTLRFSPGYCDWKIKEQEKLFSMFNSVRIGVELTDSYLMKPRKSISGVFGVTDNGNGQNIKKYNPCAECPKLDCIARRT